jgi:hypothetical protein
MLQASVGQVDKAGTEHYAYLVLACVEMALHRRQNQCGQVVVLQRGSR